MSASEIESGRTRVTPSAPGRSCRAEAVRSHSGGQTQISGDGSPLGDDPSQPERPHFMLFGAKGFTVVTTAGVQIGKPRLRGTTFLPQGSQASNTQAWQNQSPGEDPSQASPTRLGSAWTSPWPQLRGCGHPAPPAQSVFPKELAVFAWGSPRQARPCASQALPSPGLGDP